jgi:hypothetical protein
MARVLPVTRHGSAVVMMLGQAGGEPDTPRPNSDTAFHPPENCAFLTDLDVKPDDARYALSRAPASPRDGATSAPLGTSAFPLSSGHRTGERNGDITTPARQMEPSVRGILEQRRASLSIRD